MVYSILISNVYYIIIHLCHINYAFRLAFEYILVIFFLMDSGVFKGKITFITLMSWEMKYI